MLIDDQLRAARQGTRRAWLPPQIDHEDVVQDTLLNVLERQARGQPPVDPALVNCMARFCALEHSRNWRKTKARYPQLEHVTDDPILLTDGNVHEPGEFAVMIETAQIIGDVVAGLSRQKRRAITAHIQGLSAADGAAACGMGKKNYSAEISYARTKLRKVLS